MMSYEDIIENLTEQINALTAENSLLRAQNEQIRQTHYSRETVEAMMEERGEVVRCRECRHSKPPAKMTQIYGAPGTLTCRNAFCACNGRNVAGDYYCRCGEKKEDT